jgi:hypothetical protein
MVIIHQEHVIDHMRRTNAENLPLSAELQYELVQDDGQGGEESLDWKTYDTKSLGWKTYDTKCCRKSPIDPDEAVIGDQISSKLQWLIIFEWDITIPAKNRIKIGTDIFKIIGDKNTRTNQTMAKFICIEDKDSA